MGFYKRLRKSFYYKNRKMNFLEKIILGFTLKILYFQNINFFYLNFYIKRKNILFDKFFFHKINGLILTIVTKTVFQVQFLIPEKK